MVYVMRTAHGWWLWMPPGPRVADPVVLGGVGGPQGLAVWATAHRVERVQWRDHPAVPSLGLAAFAPVWLSSLPQGGWVAWRDPGRWAVPATWPTVAAAATALAQAGLPWRFRTPAAVWRAVQHGSGAADPTQAWHVGQTPTGGYFLWQAQDPPVAVRAGPTATAPLYVWPQAAAAIAFVTDHGRVVTGFCPPRVARQLVRARAVPGRSGPLAR